MAKPIMAAVLGHTGDLQHWALFYASAGLEVFPLWADKTPRVQGGMKSATTDPARIELWWHDWPDALIGCRIPEDIVVLDIDPKHNGMATWTALKAEHGPIPPGRGHKSGRGDGGGHRWFKRPPGRLSAAPLHQWAKAHGTGEAAGKHSWVSGIDLLHHGHRYTVLPPSPHPAGGRPYQWIDGHGLEAPLPDLPAWFVQLITEQPRPQLPPAPKLHGADLDSVADWFTATSSWVDLLQSEGWACVHGDGDGDGSKWRHPNASNPFSATIKHHCLFVYSPGTDFDVTEEGDPHGYTLFRAYATLGHNGNLSEAARAARYLKDGTPSGAGRDDWSWACLTKGIGTISVSTNGATPTVALDDEPEEPEPPQPWPEMPAQAFHGILGDTVAALAPHTEADRVGLLACLLAYFGAAAGAGPHFRLSGVTHNARLNMLVVGDSARARKGSAEAMARWVMRTADPPIANERRATGLNSGEGLIDAVRDPKWAKDKKGGDVLVDEGVSDKRLLLYEPEFAGRLLTAIRRSGSTISALLRMAWDDGNLQTMNSKNPMRASGAHVCVIGNATIDELIAQMSPEDIAGGLLNRFLFVAVHSTHRLPFGGHLEDIEVEQLGRAVRDRLSQSRTRTRIEFGPSCEATWPDAYDTLMDDVPNGPLGHLTARGPVQVQRLALTYALADGAKTIDVEHLEAAVAFWSYCRDSAELVLTGSVAGGLTGDADGDQMLTLLVESGRPWGMRELGRELHWDGTKVVAVRSRLERLRLVKLTYDQSAPGRPRLCIEVLR